MSEALKNRAYQIQAEIQGAQLLAKERLVFVENDAGLNSLEIIFTQNGLPYMVDGATVELVFRRPDGVTILGRGEPIRDKALYKLGVSELNRAGTVQMQVSLLKDNARLTAGQIPIYVEHEISSDEAVDTSLNYPKVAVLTATVLTLESKVSSLECALATDGYENLQAALNDILVRLATLENT